MARFVERASMLVLAVCLVIGSTTIGQLVRDALIQR